MVTDFSFSRDKSMILTSSRDCSAKLWKAYHPSYATSSCVTTRSIAAASSAPSSVSSDFQIAVNFTNKLQSINPTSPTPNPSNSLISSSVAKVASNRNRPFDQEISNARFFFMDKFVLLVRIETLLMI